MTQFHVPYTLPVVLLALALYLAVALRQAYALSWRRAVLTSIATGLLYFAALFVIVMTIVIRSLAA